MSSGRATRRLRDSAARGASRPPSPRAGEPSLTRRTPLYTIGLQSMGALAARAPGGRGRGRGRRGGARRARHGGELVRGRRVGRALLPRPALHHEAGAAGRGGRGPRAARPRPARALAAQHVAEVAQRRRRRPRVPVHHVLHLWGTTKVTRLIPGRELYVYPGRDRSVPPVNHKKCAL